jgi:hypothetical protein
MMRPILLCLIILYSFSTEILAHGINFETTKQPPVVTVKAFFSRTAPVANAVVVINAPGDGQPYQSGRTDKSGNFAFIPNALGEWTVSVDDERGHIGKVVIPVSAVFFDGEPAETEETEIEQVQEPVIESEVDQDISVYYRIALGLALIFGLTGIIYGVKAKQALRNKNQQS